MVKSLTRGYNAGKEKTDLKNPEGCYKHKAKSKENGDKVNAFCM